MKKKKNLLVNITAAVGLAALTISGSALAQQSGIKRTELLEGLIEYEVEGKPPVTLKAGDVLFIPAGTIHAAKNAETINAAELATYIVVKGKQLVVLVK